MTEEPLVMVFDDFFEDPDSMREYALSLDYGDGGSSFPSQKAEPESVQRQIHIMNFLSERVTKRPITKWEGGYNTCWQYSTEGQVQPIHHDHGKYAAIVYLTPDAPVHAGTGLYRHKATKTAMWEDWMPEDHLMGLPEDEWEQTLLLGNVYNRLIVFPAQHYHKGAGTFGDCLENGRLYQTYFFS